LLTAQIDSQVNVLCFGQNTGSATASASGGNGSSYSYSWNTTPPQTGATANNLGAGTYIVTVTDANNCTAQTSVTITQPAALLTAQIDSQVNVLCFGQNTGSATASASGGNGSSYSYSWNTTPPQTGATANNLGAGTYIVTVTDANNCTAQTSVTITQPAALLTAQIDSQVNVLCFGQNTGSATASASGGNGSSYSYSWNTTPPQTGATPITWARALTS
jgi:hypothetical protein